jgi:hypothetical protein
VTALADPSGPVRVRARAIDELIDALHGTGAVRQRVADLVAHVVEAHAAALERLVALADHPSVLETDPGIAEALWVVRPSAPDPDRIDRYGNRIESLLTAIEQSAAPDVTATATRLGTAVGELYGEQLERAFELLHESGQGAAIRAALHDDLVSSLLVVHDLHPRSMADRVADCLDELSADLPQHGGIVELVEIDSQGCVRVEIRGGSELHRWRTRLAVERAIERAAPDHGGIEVRGADDEPPAAPITTIIPVESIRRAAAPRTPSRWVDVAELSALGDGAVTRLRVEGVDGSGLLACNIGGDLYVAPDPFPGDAGSNDCRVVSALPPTVEHVDGTRFTFTAPLPVQRTDTTVEVKVP